MPKVLTRRKQAWVNKFQPDVIKGSVLIPSAADESRYYLSLVRLINQMTTETETELKHLFNGTVSEEYFTQDASISSQAKILTNALIKKFEGLFATNAPDIADHVAERADKSSSASLHSSIQQLSGGLSLSTSSLKGKLSDILKAVTTENVSLINSIAKQYLSGVQAAVMRSITTGNGLQDLIPYLANHKGITLRRARMIALDQTRKAFTGFNMERMRQLGIEEFEWLHTGGSNQPRKEHIAMSGNIYKINDPPVIDSKTGERGYPGQLVNCRCRARPIIKFGK